MSVVHTWEVINITFYSRELIHNNVKLLRETQKRRTVQKQINLTQADQKLTPKNPAGRVSRTIVPGYPG